VAWLLGLAFLITAPAAVVGLAAAERFFELGFHAAVWSTVMDHFNRWLVRVLMSLLILTGLAWAARPPWVGYETRDAGTSRLVVLWRLLLIFVGFECYRLGPGSALAVDHLPWLALVTDGVAALGVTAWVWAAPTVPWTRWRVSSSGCCLQRAGLVVMLVWTVSQVALLTSAFSTATHHPDVVWIVIDGLRADRLGPQADGESYTPRLDAFARESVWFRGALAQTSSTRTSLGSMLASRHPAEFGWGEAQFVGETESQHTYIAEFLKEAGYRTRAIVSDPEAATLRGLGSGFDHFDTSLCPRSGTERVDDLVTERGLEALGTRGLRPRFLLLEYSDPKPPYLVDAKLRNELRYEGPLSSGDPLETLRVYAPHMTSEDRRYWRRAYLAEVQQTDAAVGRFLDGLRAREDYENTVIIVSGTHGATHFERGFDVIEARQRVFAESVRVPLMVRFPGYTRGRVVARAVGLTDLVPTLQLHLGFPLSNFGFAGRAIDLGRIDEFERLPPVPIYAETRFGVARWQSVTLGRWAYVRDPHSRQRFLFDVDHDPAQRTDVSAAHPDAVAGLERLLNGWVWGTRIQDAWPTDPKIPGGEPLAAATRGRP
jgi:arylsulfatase A-like enzyme